MTVPTPAQEAVTTGMLAALISCIALSLALVEYFKLTTLLSYAILAMISFVIAGYVVPNVVAFWLGKPIHEIMTDDARAAPRREPR